MNLCTPKEGNRREWTQEEEDYLEKYYEKRGSDFIAKKFNRSKQSIKRKAQSIGVNAYVGTELYVKQISYAFNCDSRVINRWIDKLGLPCREFYRGQTKFRTIDVKKFWKWAENHKDIVPFNKYERYSLLPEPVWIRDAMKNNMNNNHRKSISSYDKMTVIRMKKVLERKYLGLARNGEHYHLFLSLLQCVTRATAEELKILAVWSVFSDTLEKENEAYLNSQKYENTVPLTEANKACDQRFSAFSMNVKAKAKSYVAEVAAAAGRIAAAMEPYKGAARKAHAENIAMVLDMTEKLQSDKYAADIATLGLTADLEDLRQSAIVFDAAVPWWRLLSRMWQIY